METTGDLTRTTLAVLFIGALIAASLWIVRPFLQIGFGLVGIFIDPVILAVGYTLLDAWVAEQPERVVPVLLE